MPLDLLRRVMTSRCICEVPRGAIDEAQSVITIQNVLVQYLVKLF